MPGNRIFEVFRIGHEALCCAEGEKEDTCPGRAQQVKGAQPEVMFDFRCHAPGRGGGGSPAPLSRVGFALDVITRGVLSTVVITRDAVRSDVGGAGCGPDRRVEGGVTVGASGPNVFGQNE